MIDKQYQRAQELLSEHIDDLNILAKELLGREVLLKSDVIKLLGERPFTEPQQHLRPEDVTDSDSKPGEELESEPISAK